MIHQSKFARILEDKTQSGIRIFLLTIAQGIALSSLMWGAVLTLLFKDWCLTQQYCHLLGIH